ncbi:MAG: carboxymuconolactone decarboxylase family protein, partial [Solirubrobacteraceae bacterium]
PKREQASRSRREHRRAAVVARTRRERRTPDCPGSQALRPWARILAEIAARALGSEPPNVFTTLGQRPRLFRFWLHYWANRMLFGGRPRRDTELVSLQVAWQCGSVYEWRQHVPIALRSDQGRAWLPTTRAERDFDTQSNSVVSLSSRGQERSSVAPMPRWAYLSLAACALCPPGEFTCRLNTSTC